MKINLMGTKIDLTPSIKEYVEEKVGSIEKLLARTEKDTSIARVEIAKTSEHHRKGDVYYAEINLKVKSELFRATSEHYDIRSAIDEARDEIKRQIAKKKTKLRDKRRRIS